VKKLNELRACMIVKPMRISWRQEDAELNASKFFNIENFADKLNLLLS